MTHYVLLIDPQSFIVGEFRIYIQMAASQSDVRLSEMGDPCVVCAARLSEPVDNQPHGSPTAYDRVDDRIFPGDVGFPASPIHDAILGTLRSGG